MTFDVKSNNIIINHVKICGNTSSVSPIALGNVVISKTYKTNDTLLFRYNKYDNFVLNNNSYTITNDNNVISVIRS